MGALFVVSTGRQYAQIEAAIAPLGLWLEPSIVRGQHAIVAPDHWQPSAAAAKARAASSALQSAGLGSCLVLPTVEPRQPVRRIEAAKPVTRA